jgi:N-acetyl-anhydromuramyl-L-alanine amidase AmpD
MRTIKYIVVHCTAGADSQTVEGLKAEFHRKGWQNPGYHYVVDRDGHIVQMLDEAEVANGAAGYNQTGIHIAWMGGRDADNRTACQRIMLKTIVKRMARKYPKAKVCGHRDLSPDKNGDGKITQGEWVKACPRFNVADEYRDFISQ